MIPYAYAVSLPRVDIDSLWSVGFRGLIIDVDNTLLGFDSEEPAPDVLQWIITAKARGFRLVLLSNNFSARVNRIAALIACPAVPSALKPLPFGFLRAVRLLGVSVRETLIIGDQLMTDMLGAKLIGIEGMLVNPIAQKDFPLTRIFRLIERVVIGSKRPAA